MGKKLFISYNHEQWEKETLPLPRDRKVYASLLRRKLVTEKDEHFTMCIPIMRRWIRKRWILHIQASIKISFALLPF